MGGSLYHNSAAIYREVDAMFVQQFSETLNLEEMFDSHEIRIRLPGPIARALAGEAKERRVDMNTILVEYLSKFDFEDPGQRW
jgi:hypothetical protein